MKRIMVLLMALLILAVPCVALTEKTENKPIVSQEDAEKMRTEVEMVGKILGIDLNQIKDGKTTKNFPEVVDKMLDMAGRFVTSIAATIEKVAPEVWSIMVLQQYAKAFGDLIPPIGLIIICMFYRRTVPKLLPVEDDPKNDNYLTDKNNEFPITKKGFHGLFRTLIPYVGGFAGAVWLIVQLAYSIKYIINPKYYAVRDIIIMILGQTHGTGK